MNSSSVRATAPGKLFLAGEYAVVEPGHTALIAAINQLLTVTVTPADRASIWSSQQKERIYWERRGRDICPLGSHSYTLIVAAMQVTEVYARSCGRPCTDTYCLEVESDLDDPDSGRKYGLGSSGAVTVATVRALLSFYQLEMDPYLVFQLSAIAQIRVGLTGSFGDLAASSYGGIVAYRSLDRNWLKEVLRENDIPTVLQYSWKNLSIERVTLPKGLRLLIGWTGQVALTSNMVAQLEQKKSQQYQQEAYQQFLSASQKCLTRIVLACQSNQSERFQEQITVNRNLLREMAQASGLLLETPALEDLCRLALEEGAVAKTSGAGGGDCGIAFVEKTEQADRIYKKWKERGILPLPFSVAEK